MNTAAILLTMAAIGVDVGWQEQKDGTIEYIIQIEPQLVGSLKEGEELTSGIRPELRNIRSYRVVVGSQKLPQNPPLAELERRLAAEKAAEAAAKAQASAAPKKPAAAPLDQSDVPSGFQNAPAPLEFPNLPSTPFGENPKPVEAKPKHSDANSTPFGANPLEAEKPAGEPSDSAQKGSAQKGKTQKDNAQQPDFEPTPAEKQEPPQDEPHNNPKASQAANVPPPTFRPDDTEQPLIQHVAAYGEASAATSPAPAEETAKAATATSETSTRPWGALIGVALALFASLALNAFLGWITVEQRGRYRSLLSRNRNAEPSAG